MKENNILITIIIVVVLIVSGGSIAFFSMSKSSNSENESDKKSVGEIVQEPVESNEKVEEQNTVIEVEQNPVAPESSTELKITKGSVSYNIVKTYVGKPAINVVGKTEIVNGSGWLDLESKSGFVEAKLDFFNIKTDIAKRDEDIKPLFKDSMITVKGKFEGLESMVVGKKFQLKSPLKLTVNGIEKEVIFDIEATVKDDMSLIASGEAIISASNFGITSPSLADVFSTDDQLTVSFEIEAAALAENEKSMDSDSTTTN